MSIELGRNNDFGLFVYDYKDDDSKKTGDPSFRGALKLTRIDFETIKERCHMVELPVQKPEKLRRFLLTFVNEEKANLFCENILTLGEYNCFLKVYSYDKNNLMKLKLKWIE